MSEREALDAFQSATRSKLAGAVCPKHRQAPRVEFSGSSLRDVSIRLTACCAEGISAANRAIAEPPPSAP